MISHRLTLRREVFQIHHSLHLLSRFKFSRRIFLHFPAFFPNRKFPLPLLLLTSLRPELFFFGCFHVRICPVRSLASCFNRFENCLVAEKVDDSIRIELSIVCRFSNKTIGASECGSVSGR